MYQTRVDLYEVRKSSTATENIQKTYVHLYICICIHNNKLKEEISNRVVLLGSYLSVRCCTLCALWRIFNIWSMRTKKVKLRRQIITFLIVLNDGGKHLKKAIFESFSTFICQCGWTIAQPFSFNDTNKVSLKMIQAYSIEQSSSNLTLSNQAFSQIQHSMLP